MKEDKTLAKMRADADAEFKAADGPIFVNLDSQGNPLNADGTLNVEKINSIDELTDDNFMFPTKNVQIPYLPKNIDEAIGAGHKPVVIKRNIFKKNQKNHGLTPEQSRSILQKALYNTELYGRTQPKKRPLNWVVIKLDDKSPITVLEVNNSKDNVEIVGWYTLDGRNLERIKRQAQKNGGELVMLSLKEKVESLSTPQKDLSSAAKVQRKTESAEKNAENDAESREDGQANGPREQRADGVTPVSADIAEAWTKAKEKNPSRIALVHIGDNYVTYGADAAVCADVLNIGTKAVADSRLEQKAEFPHKALYIYLEKLLSEGHPVAILDILNGGNTAPTESVTPKAEAQENNPLPIGRGAFGDIYDAFKGKARKAFDFLLRKKSGDLLGVFHRDGVGYIDLVWGDKGGGFDHIVSKHVGEGKSFSTVDEAAIVIDDIIKTGKKDFEDGDKIVFKKGSKLVTI